MPAMAPGQMPSPWRMTTPAMPHMRRSAILRRSAGQCRRADQSEEIAQDAQADLAAFLGMELRPIDVAGAQRRRHAPAVIMAIAQATVLLGRLGGEGVHEIAGRTLRDAVKN